MHVDFLTLACLKQDLQRLTDGRIQQVVQPDAESVAIELYAGFRTTLVLDSSVQHSRAFLQDEKARRGVEKETPLWLLLRKYLLGGRLRAVHQPPWERMLEMEVESAEGRVTLVAEIMGKYSNLLLLDEEGMIRECLRHVGARRNEYRVTLPGHAYVPPPPLTKRPPPALDEAAWAGLLAAVGEEQPLFRLLVRDLAGVSPTLAREIVARVAGEPDAPASETDPPSLVEVVRELFAPLETGSWEPHMALDDEGEVIAFAPYELTQYETAVPVDTISEAMRRFFATRMDTEAYATARGRIAEMVAEGRKRVESTIYQLNRQLVDPAEVEQIRENGELLLAYQWQVARHASNVELPDFEGELRTISLDPNLTPVENAQKLFDRYEKKKRAAAEIPPLLQSAEQDLAFLTELANDLRQAEERPEIDAVRDALEAAGFAPAKRRRRGGGGAVRGPRRVVLGEWVAWIGRNSAQNDEITFRRSSSDDLWLHARGIPGSHVILKTAGREPPHEVIEHAASLAAFYSQARDEAQVPVDVTERRHVRRISGARPGLVTYRNERTLQVKPISPEELDEELDA
jgi:predicted ribosome quality control (RQC) complex YloA/Tae2 family protein